MEDEASFYRQPCSAPIWSRRGRVQPRMRMSCRSNSAVRAAVAYDPAGGQLAHCLRSHFTASAVGAFFAQVGKRFAQRRIYLVMDNWPVHAHPRVNQVLASDPRLQVLWLPTYAPWLNPTEKVWKWLRQRFVHAHDCSDNLPNLRAGLDRHLTYAAQHPVEILSFTGNGNNKLYC